MTRRLRPAFIVIIAAAAGGAMLGACTLTQSLDYLQEGGEGGTPGNDAGNGGGEGGGEAGSRNGEIVVTNQTKPDHLAQDDTNLYWSTGGTVQSIPKAGGTPKTIGVAPSVTFIAADPGPGGFVFVAAGRDVWRFPKDGSDGGVVFSAPAQTPPVDTVLADQAGIFVLQADVNEESSLIVKMAKDGTAQVDLAGDAGAATLIAQEKDTLFWMDSTLDPTTFYELAKSAAPGTPATAFPLPVDDEYPVLSAEVAADATNMYWMATDANLQPLVISRKRQKGAPAIKLLRGSTVATFGNIAIDDMFVYVLDLTGGTVLRGLKAGTSPPAGEVVMDGLIGPTAIVVDATNVYVTVEATGAMGAVLKRKK